MSKFISKIKEISTKFNSGASTEPEPPDTDKELDKQEKPQPERGKMPPPLKPLKHFWSMKSIKPFFIGSKPLYRRYSFWIGLGLGGSVVAAAIGWRALESSLPDTVDVVGAVRSNTLTIKASDGKILQQTGPATRESLKIDKIPKRLIEAFIAIEDRRFYQHEGVDYQGVLRAAVSNMLARDVVEGGSTITQQLVRIILLDQERSFERKFKEIRLAQKVEDQLTKNEILERYLNLVYLGEGAYGVADAAWVYFSKTIYQLNLPEMATLAAIPPAPSVYSPVTNQQAIQERRNLVLQRMQDLGYITAEEAKEAKATPLTTKQSPPARLNRDAAYFTAYVLQELPKHVSPEALKIGGLTVETTVKPDWQNAAEEAVKETIEDNGRGQNFEQASLVAIDPRTGEIRAMVGGKDFFKQQFNRVTQAQRQPGSTFKMFIYATAMAAGFSPYRSYQDAPFTVDGYTPKNYNEGKFRGWITIQDALTSSINTVAVKALLDVGWNPVINIANKMGIESELQPTYSLALGASEVNLLELTSAYGTLATKGLHTKPYGIRRILDRRGKVIFDAKPKPERALDTETSAIMTWLLRGVVNNGTGQAAQLDDRPVAGKTGTSDEARDLWFIGYIPQMVAGIWLGNDNNKPTWGASTTAAYTWRRFMVKVVKEMPVEKFPERPEKLEGRKSQIKREQIRPAKIVYGKITTDADTDTQTSRRSRYSEDSSSDNRPRRRRRRQQVESQEQAPPTTYRRRRRRRVENTESQNNYQEQPRRRRRRRVENSEQGAAPRRSSSNFQQAEAAPLAPRASRRAVDVSAPLAPPAERKSE